jgi:dipeptidyl aminopeptidase/acylaminoacyl peptidase
MLLKAFRIAMSALAGGSLLPIAAMLVSEMRATRAPAFPEEGNNPLTELNLPFEHVAFPAADGLMLRGWFIPTDQPDAPAILYAHGSGRDQRSGLPLVPTLHQAGYHVLLFSYRGFGLSDGNGRGLTYGCGESQDVDSAVAFLHRIKGIRQIGAVGYSVGAVSVILSAARNPHIEAVLAIAPFACVSEVWASNRPLLIPPFVLDLMLRLVEWRKGFNRTDACPVEVISRIAPRPLLLVHSTTDEHIPLAQAQRLFSAAGQPKILWLMEGESHDSIRKRTLEGHASDIVAFFDAAMQLIGRE